MQASIFPWQIKPWQQLQKILREGKLPHALLISGENNGELAFASQFARSLFCAEICGECSDCRWIMGGQHPDYFSLIADTNTAIKIDEIRELTAWLDTSAQSTCKLALIALAENMTLAAANALLKKLEEPVGEKIIILVSKNASLLLPTIKSRCYHLHLPLPTKNQSNTWLNEHFPAVFHAEAEIFELEPLYALNMAENADCKNYAEIIVKFLDDKDCYAALVESAKKIAIEDMLTITWRSLHRQLKLQAINHAALWHFSSYFELVEFIQQVYKALKQSIRLNDDIVRENFLLKLKSI